ncbi:MAG: DUF4831 family protein [Candidatus Amulumruptor caecigallinarius]|nr:DUF4831 family protein [Candidatus Amulumruptor caecigallinarius]MCM1397124.1 DUF4831 family protein [Candidatus Amulumruptor caecigallinarius]MCM1453934.1 DUF4831 family protein [bacterium]
MARILAAAAILATMLPATATAQTTQKLTATKATDWGLVYNLPDLEVRVTLEAKRTVRRPGELHNYAVKYLKSKPITETSEEWQLMSATINTRPVVNPDERYSVQFKSGSQVSMLLGADGTPLSVNDESYQPAVKADPLPQAKEAAPTILDLPVARQALTEEMMQSTSTAKRAELAAAKIYEIRQQRSDIISGNADAMPSDGAAMKLALDNLAAQEEALTAMFNGVTSESTEVMTFTFRPGTSDEKAIIARISELRGLVPSDDLSGAPVYINYTVNSRGELPLTDRGEERKFPKGGLAYRIPGEATVSISFDGRTLAKQRLEVPQLGVVYGLDPAIFTDKKAPSYVHFDPVTGAIVETGTRK